MKRNRPTQHQRKAHYRKGKYVSATWVNKGFENIGKNAFPMVMGIGKKGFEIISKKSKEAAERRAEQKAKERTEVERKEALGIYEGKESLPKKLVHAIPTTKYFEERAEKKHFEAAQKKAAEQRLEQEKRVYEIQKKKEENVGEQK